MRNLLLGALLLFAVMCLTASVVHAQAVVVTPDLAKITDGKLWKVVNAAASTTKEDGKQAVRLQVKEDGAATGSNVGFAWVEGLEFAEGTIEIDLKGQNKPQASFLGVVFHGVDEKTFEAVYFRPFNFVAEDAARRARSVQYIAWPTYTWEKLRKERPNTYENAVNPVPNPNGWFHARIEVAKKTVRVFVDNAKEPSLVVERLSEREQGRIGLWVDVKDGTFANLKVTPARSTGQK